MPSHHDLHRRDLDDPDGLRAEATQEIGQMPPPIPVNATAALRAATRRWTPVGSAS